MGNRWAGDGAGVMHAFTKEADRGQVSQDEDGVHGTFTFPSVVDSDDFELPAEVRQSFRWKIPVIFAVETEGLEDAILLLGEALDKVGIDYMVE